VRTDNQTNNI